MAKIMLKDGRLTFPQLYEPKEVKSDDGTVTLKYSGSVVFPRTHPQIAEIQKAIVDAAEAKWPGKSADILKQLKAADRLPVHDGDAKSDYAGYAGNLYINASNKIRPLVIDGNRAPLTASDGKPYSGCYVNVSLEIWAQDNKYGKRVNASLLGVQFVRDGERLAGGSVAAADDFQEIPQAQMEQAAVGGAAALF